MDRDAMESLKLESERIMEKLTEEKGKPDFEEQLRELNAEISGKVDMGCNVEKVFKARILETEKKVSANHKENRVSEDSTHGLRFGLPRSGLQDVLGHIEADDGFVETKAPLAQVMELRLFQIGPKKSSAIERGSNKKA